jgi:hypothetical protein
VSDDEQPDPNNPHIKRCGSCGALYDDRDVNATCRCFKD